MANLKYIWAKVLKKIRGSAIKNSFIHQTSKVESGSSIVNVKMNKHSFCGYNCDIANCEIGSFVSIANNVIIGGGMHPVDWVGMSPVFYEGRDSVKAKFSEFQRPKPLTTYIGSDVWIGNNVLIKQGVKINHGAVIGMGSVVTKDVEAYSIVGGVPAKVIRKRFDDVTIKKLLKSRWWDLEDSNLSNYSKYFNNVNEFLKNF